MDKAAVKESVDSFLENPHWKKYHDEAPSDKCREYIALDFYYSDTEDDKAAEAMDAMEKDLSAEDWKHIAKYAGNTPFAAKCRQMIERLGG